jgi:hypothetical protein
VLETKILKSGAGRVKEQTTNMRIMKTKYMRAGGLLMAAGGLMLMSGCVVEPNGQVAFQPFVVAPAPVYVGPPPVYVGPPPVYVAPPVVDVQIGVPDYYVWDGYENIGLIGGSYFYLGPGNVWLGAEPFRLDRFHGWEGSHPDWRNHAILNDRFRNDRFGHAQPMRSEQVRRDELARHDDQVRHDDRGNPGDQRRDVQGRPGEPGKPVVQGNQGKGEAKPKKDEEQH